MGRAAGSHGLVCAHRGALGISAITRAEVNRLAQARALVGRERRIEWRGKRGARQRCVMSGRSLMEEGDEGGREAGVVGRDAEADGTVKDIPLQHFD